MEKCVTLSGRQTFTNKINAYKLYANKINACKLYANKMNTLL